MNEIDRKKAQGLKKSEFLIFNQKVETVSVGYGIFLIIWGVIISVLSESQSFTSLIPTIFGSFLMFFSILALRFPKKRMLFMHIVVVIALFVMLGGADFFRGLYVGSNLFANIWAGTSKLMMFLTGVIFILTCIKFFLVARKQKDNEINN